MTVQVYQDVKQSSHKIENHLETQPDLTPSTVVRGEGGWVVTTNLIPASYNVLQPQMWNQINCMQIGIWIQETFCRRIRIWIRVRIRIRFQLLKIYF